MQVDLKAFAETELNLALAGIVEKNCFKYMEIFRKKQTEFSELGNEDFALMFGLLSEVASMWLDSEKNEPLKPMMVFEGRETATPQNIKDEFIELLANFLPHIHDPELNARVADILWLRKRDYLSGKQAISTYLSAAQNLEGTEHWISQVIKRVERSIQLARQLNDHDGLQNAINYLKYILERYKADSSLEPYVLLHVLDLLEKYKLMKENAGGFAALAEIGATEGERQKNWRIAQQYWRNKAKWHQLEDNGEKARLALVAAAEVDVYQAKQAADEIPPRFLASTAFIEDAITALRRIGGQQERIDELHNLLIQYGQESLKQMGEISFSMDVKSYVDKARNAVTRRTVEEALTIWLQLADFPALDRLRAEAKRNIAEYPFRFLVSSRTLNDLGKTVTRQTGGDLESDEIVRDEMLRLATIYQEADVASVIGPALYQINIEHNIRIQDLLPVLENNPFVPIGHEDIYAKGLVAGLRDDGLVAAHLLLPQLESSLREILILSGKITSGLGNDLIQDEYPLSTILYWPELVNIFGADVVFSLRALLVERYGSNLRNLMAHGLMQHKDFYSYRITYLTWLTLKLLMGFLSIPA
ncbi:MAG: DUF4209 domain-containing protein [Chloroflexi bacterium]|nr:DUF4209 domain-containing protein [Chloroflexota bacterium]